jgi:uncharacterized membrane protein
MPKNQMRRAPRKSTVRGRTVAPPIPRGRPVAPPAPGRVALVDAARGLAVATMIAYHFCFDLTYFGWASWQMLDDPAWIAWRNAIVASFLFVCGISLALRDLDARWLERRFVRRWAQVAGAALLVTAGSWFVVHERYIWFGVLHFVAVALWICRRAPKRPFLALLLGIVALGVGLAVQEATFDRQELSWIGFVTHKPLTDDYVPLFPWLGVVLFGCAAGGWWARHGLRIARPVAQAWDAVPRPGARGLAAMGRWSLTIYLVHQPILLGAMAGIHALA